MSALRYPVRGGYVWIDETDLALVSSVRWSIQTYGRSGMKYASGKTRGDRTFVFMHRLLIGARSGEQVDHRNGNGLDNRRINLRLCTRAQNNQNRSSGRPNSYKGVYQASSGSWHARIHADGVRHLLGNYPTAEDAARAYDEAAVRLHGAFARLNFPNGA